LSKWLQKAKGAIDCLFIYLFMPPSIGCNWRLSPWWTNGDLVLDADADAEADLDPWMPCAMP